MTHAHRITLLVAGAALVLVGALLGLVPSSITVAGTTTTCGSPWAPDTSAAGGAEFTDRMTDVLRGIRPAASSAHQRCSEALGSRGIYGGAVVVLGVAALAAVALASRGQRRDAAPDQPATA